jgi:leucyl-tRNA synthetase
MDTFVDSSWYHLRYASPNYHDGPVDPDAEKSWLPVNQYTGGAEHAVMHLLYSRFFNKALRDLGIVHYDEPYPRLFNQGTIIADHQKMSKSRGNVVTPDPYVQEFGADVVRIYLMFLGPWDQGGEWADAGLNGMARWLNRVWDISQRNVSDLKAQPASQEANRDLLRITHKTVKRVENDLERFKFNTALAAMMELTNYMGKAWDDGAISATTWKETIEKLLLLLAPIAPHVTEELWERTGHAYSIHSQLMPQWDEEMARDEEIILVIQVNGKVRDRIQVAANIGEEDAKRLAMESRTVQPHLDGKQVLQIVYVPGRLVNIVAG